MVPYGFPSPVLHDVYDAGWLDGYTYVPTPLTAEEREYARKHFGGEE